VGSGISVLAIILFLALLTETIVERLFGSWLKGYWLILIASAMGVGLAFAYKLDIVNLVLSVDITAWGKVLTGLVIGAGSDTVHGVMKRYALRKQ